MRFSKHLKCISCILLQLVALYAFLRGFFPIKVANLSYASFDDNLFDLDPLCIHGEAQPDRSPSCFVPRSFSRMVFILIDALRSDFVLPNSAHSGPSSWSGGKDVTKEMKMEFVWRLIADKSALAFVSKAHPPTVTLPRIKALTTGTVPGFIDVITNLDTVRLTEDNFVSQLVRHGRQSVFYGDDTWLRLFPEHFVRSDGMTSFFISDYTEVDNNVTRHLGDELGRSDWDVLFLHYLGLDHIGHLAGPTSPLVRPKLNELDNITRFIYESLVAQNELKGELPTLLVLCGDHGMSDQGSHGGASDSETLTPLVFMSSAFQRKEPQAAQVCEVDEVKQIDVAVTLSLLLGLPVPRNSLGSLILPPLSTLLSPEQQLRAAYVNAKQVRAVVNDNVEDILRHPGYHDLDITMKMHLDWLMSQRANASGKDVPRNVDEESKRVEKKQADKILSRYVRSVRLMRDELVTSQSRYDLHAMSLGIYIELAIFVTMITSSISNSSPRSSFSSAFIISGIFDLSIILIGCASAMTHLVSCTGQSEVRKPLLCSPYGFLFPVGAVVLYCTVLVLTSVKDALWRITRLWLCDQDLQQSDAQLKTHVSHVSDNLTVPLIAGSILHAFSLMSSSFVEEEHQTWYFLTTTILFLILLLQAVPASSHPLTISKSNAYVTSYQDMNINPLSATTGGAKLLLNHGTITHRQKHLLDNLTTNENFLTEKYQKHKTRCVKIDAKTASEDNDVVQQKTHQIRTPAENSCDDNRLLIVSEQSAYELGRQDTCVDKTSRCDMGSGRVWVRLWSMLASVGCLCLCRIARSLNQTGDKWAHLPDISDWLVRPENSLLLSSSNILSLVVLCWITSRQTKDIIIAISFLIGSISVYCHQSAQGVVHLPLLYDGNITKGITEARLVYISVLIIISRSLYICYQHLATIPNPIFSDEHDSTSANEKRSLIQSDKSPTPIHSVTTSSSNDKRASVRSEQSRSPIYFIAPLWRGFIAGFALLAVLIGRPHNVVLVAILYFQSICLREVVMHTGGKGFLTTRTLTILYVWMGQAAFYYQGNSNSLSTVNLASGYKGLYDYNFIIVGALTIIGTYIGPIFWLLALMELLATIQQQQHLLQHQQTTSYADAIFIVVHTVLTMRALVLSPYLLLVTIQRYHLFVWTVFSPKLLYEAMLTGVLSTLLLLLSMTTRLLTRNNNSTRPC